MTDARKHILDCLGAGQGQAISESAPLLPAFVKQAERPALLFKEKLEAVHSRVDIAYTAEQIGQSIEGFLGQHDCPLDVATLAGNDLSCLPENSAIGFHNCEDVANSRTILTRAAYGVAETGSLVLPSSATRPTLANFLPDNCIVLIDEADILLYLEDALSVVKQSDQGMPRALNLISGPSKTADIEQTLVYGAHGPIQMQVIILGAEEYGL